MLRKMLALCVLFVAGAGPAVGAAPNIDGDWILTVDRWGNPEYSTLSLSVRNGEVSGDLDGNTVVGKVDGKTVHLTMTDDRKAVYRFDARLTDGRLSGTANYPDNNFPDRRVSFALIGRRVPDRPSAEPQVINYAPPSFANSFSAQREPVLTIWPGDVVRTSTIDSGGIDAQGVTRALFGNPQTGPFFIAGARQGDTLAIHIRKLTLNRDWAESLDTIVARVLGTGLVAKASDLGRPVRWRLDRQAGIAMLENPGERLKNYRIPLRPMLGGLGLASGFGSPPLSTGDTGRSGGNMDFPEIVAGTTVYLPVQQPGALLYLGDGHAVQGDGETSQYALETSLDVEFSVNIVKGPAIMMPRVESADEIMALGQAGSVDEATKAATTGLIQWMQRDYGLSLSDAAKVLGSAVRYSIPNLAGRSVGVAARIDKALLPPR